MKGAKVHGSPKENGSTSLERNKPLPLDALRRSTIEKPTPLDFDAFVPWVCMEWQCPDNVTITRAIQEDHTKADSRRASTKSTRSLKLKTDEYEVEPKKSATASKTSPKTLTHADESSVPVKAYYDARGHLVEISIVGCPFNIHRKVVHAFSLCLSFHSLLSKLTIRKGGVTSILLHELGKLLPHSNLTDICLDDSCVPEENFYVLLEHTSQLKILSLNRCCISDYGCKQIASKMYSNSNLIVLELGSNRITDAGALAFASVLRCNRRLIHLNLSGNMISDTAAIPILKHLIEFPVTAEEILQTRRNKMKYAENKMAVYERCLEEVVNKRVEQESRSSIGRKSLIRSKGTKVKKKSTAATALIVDECPVQVLADIMTNEIVGEFSDPFSSDHTIKRDDIYYCIGNMFLGSLNLANNNLGYLSIKKINEVLKYQEGSVKPVGATGLIRVVVDGNYIPKYCKEYIEIDMILKKAATDLIPVMPSPMQQKKKSAMPRN